MLCSGCGNEVTDPERCPICKAGRGTKPLVKQKRNRDEGRCSCPRCDEFLDQQSWEGTATLTCPSCRGTFFPDRGLEVVLNKLRATCDPVDMATVLEEFKGRFTRELPEAVRYKACPVCSTIMLRRNYGNVSGVITDVCGDHGTWVDEQAFAELADFVCRGGDQLAKNAASVRARTSAPTGSKANQPSLLQKFFGS